MLSNDTKNTTSFFIDQKLCKFSQPSCQQAFAIASKAFTSAGDWFTSTGKYSPPLTNVRQQRAKGSPLEVIPRRFGAPRPNRSSEEDVLALVGKLSENAFQ
ncbi:hypothetical protein R1flu_008337 [Riccia fluitans]|uniref:Uncharacterized protein n=1 Tax=Riccia fluitans TaxID=41844 RepID=A0ABD1YEZ5_9MARC